MSKHAFSDLRTAAYCPRKCYYRWQADDRDPPPEVETRRELAFRYPELLDGADLANEPIAVTPTQFKTNISCAKARFDAFDELSHPTERDVFLDGKECRGIAHKVLDLDSPVPSLVSTGAHRRTVSGIPKPSTPSRRRKPSRGSAKRPSSGRSWSIRPMVSSVRFELTTRRKAAYRTAVNTLAAIDGPPPRLADSAKCESCEYREDCGVKTRSLRSLLGFG